MSDTVAVEAPGGGAAPGVAGAGAEQRAPEGAQNAKQLPKGRRVSPPREPPHHLQAEIPYDLSRMQGGGVWRATGWGCATECWGARVRGPDCGPLFGWTHPIIARLVPGFAFTFAI